MRTRSPKLRPCAILLVAVLLGVSPGCRGRRSSTASDPVGEIPVTIAIPLFSNHAARASVELLQSLFPRARTVAAAAVAAELPRCLEERRVLLVPDVARFPSAHGAALEAYLAGGGAAVFVGRDPFQEPAALFGKRWETSEHAKSELFKSARPVAPLSSIHAWQHLNDSGAMKGSVKLARAPDPAWAAISVEVKDFESWDHMTVGDLPSGAVSGDADSVLLYARADASLSRLVVTCEEQDGSRWYASLPVSASWQAFAVHGTAFLYAYGGAGRGGADDHLSLARLRTVSVGLSAALAPQPAGDHLFEISEIRVAADPRPARFVAGAPDIDLVSPACRTYETRAGVLRSLDSGERFEIGSALVQSPLPRARGWGGDAANPARWIPLFEALDRDGRVLGWPASIHVEAPADGPVRAWAWVGIDPSKPMESAARSMIGDAAARLHRGQFLIQGGCNRFAFGPKAELEGMARSVSMVPGDVRISAELLRPGGKAPVRRVVATEADEGRAFFHLGIAPSLDRGMEEYILRVILEDARIEGRRYDTLDQPIKIIAERPVPVDADRIVTGGSRFIYRGRPLFLLGINYWPLTTNGRLPGERNPHWLDPAAFDPELVARDLDRLVEVGINAVSIQYLDENQAPQLQYFLDEARRRGLWVHLFVSGLQPLDQDLSKARRLCDAAGLARDPGVFAIDLAWEPHLGVEADRRRLDPEWRKWLFEQYGTIEHAEAVIGRPLWRVEGEVTGPPDAELIEDGDHRVAVTAYRRFVDDWMSRAYGHVARELRRWGCRQLLGARTGYGGTGHAWGDRFLALDPVTGSAHLDFISPEGWGLHGSRDRFMEAGFITAYCRGLSGGKPVMWLEFGSSVGVLPQAVDLENQARVYKNMFDLALQSRAAAALGWWYPSGWRVDERSDMGVVNPDATWRPVGDVYREFNNTLRRANLMQEPWRGREVDVSADARGLSALWDAWRDTYRKEMAEGRPEEMRPMNHGRRSGEIPLTSVGGVPFEDPAPLKHVNSEWGTLQVDGAEVSRAPGTILRVRQRRTIRAELINTGAATWDASQEGRTRVVWVGLEQPNGGHLLLPVRPVAAGARIFVSWIASDPGVWRARPELSGVGSFGEALEIHVSAGDEPPR